MADVSEEKRFETNMIQFGKFMESLISEAKDSGNTSVDPKVVSLAVSFLDLYDEKQKIENFIEYSFEFWESIADREEQFFERNCRSIFRDIPEKYVDRFISFYHSGYLTTEDKEDIWEFFRVFVKICLKYIHRKREPTIIYDNGEKKKVYSKNEFPSIRLKSMCKKFEVELKWPEE
jgi:hypothetical protein